MSYTCPVCKTNHKNPQDCNICGFATPPRLFLSEPDAKKWFNVEVLPRRVIWETKHRISELEERLSKLEELAKSRDDEVQKLRAENKQLEKRLHDLPKQPPAPQPTMPKSGGTKIDARIGGTITFGRYQWRVLNVQNGQALVLSERAIENRRYHDKFEEVTWETCTLRRYLNGEFYNSFSTEEKARIAETTIPNNNNPQYGTEGGNATEDRIFLLSIEEVEKYLDDTARRAVDVSGAASWWWLRSPGYFGNDAAGVDYDGRLLVNGHDVHNHTGGVHPALLLNL